MSSLALFSQSSLEIKLNTVVQTRMIFCALNVPSTLPSWPEVLDHQLNPYFDELSRFSCTAKMEGSPLYRKLRPEIERVLAGVIWANLDRRPVQPRRSVRATAWNIERGMRLEEIIRSLGEHPVLKESDLLLLTELDYGMVRTGNRFVAKEIAEALDLNYAFATCYLNLNRGTGLETLIEGENAQALHGNSLFSRYPISQVHAIALPNGKDKMNGSEKRLGCQRAVVADIDHPLGAFRAVTLHLDAHSTQRHRCFQMKLVLDHLEKLSPRLPVVIGGDWNTSTYNSRRALYSILGYARRVLMGIRNVLANHYPYPERWFERRLFRELERRGYSYHELNELGVCTLHYDVADPAVNENMAEWIPQWCFWFIRWALKRTGGQCSMKLDWFAGKEIEASSSHPPKVLCNLHPSLRLSDHDPIVLDFLPANCDAG